ncbi:MAG: hypothetical protein DRJ46_03690 [Thermoprotei archaeon]|nr:MAG: hypothetical protein DRJ46_03690 [Thermoprotei archaeon]
MVNNQIEVKLDEVLKKLAEIDEQREEVIKTCREVVRLARQLIVAVHRQVKDEEALEKLRAAAEKLKNTRKKMPSIYYTGCAPSSLVEYVEAECFYAYVFEDRLPAMEDLGVDPSIYLLGVADFTGEIKRHLYELIKEERFDDAEKALKTMEKIYDKLRTAAVPNALAQGLRRKVDVMRTVLETARRDLLLMRRLGNLEKAFEAAP